MYRRYMVFLQGKVQEYFPPLESSVNSHIIPDVIVIIFLFTRCIHSSCMRNQTIVFALEVV